MNLTKHVLAYIALAGAIASPVQALAFAGGDGSSGNPWQITDWQDLHEIRNDLNAYYILVNNIDENTAGYSTYGSSAANSGSGWLPIGTSGAAFKGSLDGDGFTISGLAVQRTGTNFVGLFGYATGSTATIKDLTVNRATIRGFQNTGGIAGRIQSGVVIDNVHFQGTVESFYNLGSTQIGGLVGDSQSSPNSTIRNSSSDAIIIIRSGSAGGVIGNASSVSITNTRASSTISNSVDNSMSTIGGFAGSVASGSTIASSSASSTITITSSSAFKDAFGGFAGNIQQSASIQRSAAYGTLTITNGTGQYHGGFVGQLIAGSITDSYTRVNVQGIGAVGGFVGGHTGATAKTITRSYAANSLTTSSTTASVHGFLAQAVGSNMTFTNNYWDSTIGPATSVSEGAGAITGTSTAQMKKRNTFSGWDFATVWGMNNVSPASNNNGYPFLRWQSFTNAYNLASVTTGSASNVSATAATLGGTITPDSNATITNRGFDYGTTDSYGSSISSGSGTWSAGSFTSSLSNLTCNTTYHFRTAASVTDGSEDQDLTGPDATFTTSACPVEETPTSSSRPSGGSVRSRAANLAAIGNTEAAEALKAQWPQLFAASAASGMASPAPSPVSVRDLELGMMGDDVLALQKLLNASGFLVASSGAGSPGNETSYFGARTKAALAAYQAKNGISPAQGYFGPRTRAAMKSLGLVGWW